MPNASLIRRPGSEIATREIREVLKKWVFFWSDIPSEGSEARLPLPSDLPKLAEKPEKSRSPRRLRDGIAGYCYDKLRVG